MQSSLNLESILYQKFSDLITNGASKNKKILTKLMKFLNYR